MPGVGDGREVGERLEPSVEGRIAAGFPALQ
jgi:hypothetical protein